MKRHGDGGDISNSKKKENDNIGTSYTMKRGNKHNSLSSPVSSPGAIHNNNNSIQDFEDVAGNHHCRQVSTSFPATSRRRSSFAGTPNTPSLHQPLSLTSTSTSTSTTTPTTATNRTVPKASTAPTNNFMKRIKRGGGKQKQQILYTRSTIQGRSKTSILNKCYSFINSNNNDKVMSLSSWLASFYSWWWRWLPSTMSIDSAQNQKQRMLDTIAIVHPIISLQLLVLIDMFAVSLVIPLLFQYYQRAGITSANQRELLSSIFSMAQIIGGLSMGLLTDAGAIQRKSLLLLSFSGSAISYAMIVYGGLSALLVSRVLVGLVKQTMTVTIAIVTKITDSSNRAKYMGQITASSTVAWIIGPSVGAILFKYVDTRAPALVACGLFLINVMLTLLLIQDDETMEKQYYHNNNHNDQNHSNINHHNQKYSHDNEQHKLNHTTNDETHRLIATSTTITASSTTSATVSASNHINDMTEYNNYDNSCSTGSYGDYFDGGEGGNEVNINTTENSIIHPNETKNNKKKGFRTMVTNLRSCFSSKILGSVVVTKLIITWVGQATNYSSLGSFYENMYGLEPHHRGYISSYQQALQFIVQSFLVERVLHLLGGERKATVLFTIVMIFGVGFEAFRSLSLFVFILCPMISLCFSMVNLSLQTLVTHVAPTDTIFSVLAALDVLQNVAHVSVPFYRTALFRFLRPTTTTTTTTSIAVVSSSLNSTKNGMIMMEGDPDPVWWVISSAIHWMIAAIFVAYLLLFSNKLEWDYTEERYQHHNHHTHHHHQHNSDDNQNNVNQPLTQPPQAQELEQDQQLPQQQQQQQQKKGK